MVLDALRPAHHPTARAVALRLDELLLAALLTAGLVVVGIGTVTADRHGLGPEAPAVQPPSARPAPAVPGR